MLRILLAATVLCCLTLATGCSWWRNDERHQRYLDTQSGRTLEVPPTMDSPARRDDLEVPAGELGKTSISPMPPGAIDVIAGGTDGGVKIDLAPPDAFDEIKAALTAAEVGRIERANAATLSIRVSVITKKTRSRWFRKDKVEEIEVMRTLTIAADGAGSVVTVSDESGKVTEDDAAARLLGIVRDRFGG
ncbi:MAG: hypothetical protein IPK97_11840 [Ahniella sp.]|nr:hypothetical protein [Ahniella sp.]